MRHFDLIVHVHTPLEALGMMKTEIKALTEFLEFIRLLNEY